MRKFSLFLCAILLALCSYAQSTVTGTVKTEKDEPLELVSIKVKGAKTGTQTDVKGHFSISVPANATLQISFVGYTSQEIRLDGRTSVSLTLVQSESKLDETVVIGYQKVTRKLSSAAISSISGKELANLPAASFDQLLQGRLSGVNVQNFSGAPGASPTVSVRGNSLVSSSYDEYNVVNSPLYVVDGVPQPTEAYVTPGAGTGSNYLGGINPNDIESIDVLKDASAAAIYGSRAANGVILITTKKGRSGAPRVIVNVYGGLITRPKLRDVTLGAAERRQKMSILQNQLLYADQKQLPFILTDSLNPAFNGNTDWQDLFYQKAIIKNADLSLTGGGDGGMSYRFSSGYYDEQGIVKATGFKRYSMRLNLQSKALRGKLDINPIISFSRSDKDRGNGDDASPLNIGAGNMPSSLLNLDPNKREYLLGAYNNALNKNISNQFNFNLNLGYTFGDHLRFNSQNSYIYSTGRRDQSQTNLLTNGTGNNSYSYSENRTSVLSSNYLTYNNSFGKHNLAVVVGSDVNFDQFQNTSALALNGASDQIQVVQGFQQTKTYASSDYQAFGLLSYYGRMVYDFNNKYILTFSARTDGSSRFGENNKWGFFPAASAAWLISEEKFMRNSMFSLLKIRGSYGVSGSLPRDNYLQFNRYRVNAGGFNGNSTYLNYINGLYYTVLGASTYNGQTAITPDFANGAAQKNLSWERNKQWNVGMDIEIANGRFSASLDAYNKEGSLQLYNVNLPVTTGYDKALTNSIGVRNAGLELTLSGYPLPKKSPVRWYSSVNISYNNNQIMSLPNGGRDLIISGDRFDKSHILSIGKPINSFYLYQTLGVYSTVDDIPANPYTGERYSSQGQYNAGDFYLADLDGDYHIDVFNDEINPDKLPVGNPTPKFTGGWTNNFNWKGFSVGIFLAFAFDRDVLNLFESDQFSNSTDGDAVNRFASTSTPDFSKINIWRNPGDKADYAKYDIGTYRYYYTGAQTFFLEKGGFVRVKSVNLGYSFSSNLLKKLKLNELRVYGVVDNMAIFQQSKKLPDAEAVNPYGEYIGQGYPLPKKFTLGVTVQF